MPSTNARPHQSRHFCASQVAAAAGFLLLAGAVTSAQANIDIVFDYSYDTGFFNSNPARKSLLEAAALSFESRLTDSLTAISSGGGNSFNAQFFDPTNPAATITLNGFSVAASEVRVFVGASGLGGALGVGGPGGFGASGTLGFLDNASSRGQAGALGPAASRTDFGPWGGSIGFDSGTSWYFDTDPATVEPFAGSFDFYSVAVHELGHVLGIGTQASWNNRISGMTFNGTAAGVQTLSPDLAHWAVGTMSFAGVNAQEAAMSPSIDTNERKYFTTLDFAGMTDIGWQVSAVPEPAAWLMWGAGGAMLVGLRRRRARASSQGCAGA